MGGGHTQKTLDYPNATWRNGVPVHCYNTIRRLSAHWSRQSACLLGMSTLQWVLAHWSRITNMHASRS